MLSIMEILCNADLGDISFLLSTSLSIAVSYRLNSGVSVDITNPLFFYKSVIDIMTRTAHKSYIRFILFLIKKHRH